jgi:hypothetical protein
MEFKRFLAGRSSERTALDHGHQYNQCGEKGKEMSLKNITEQFKRLPPATQVALVVFALTVVALLVFFPSAGTSIITFLVALKMLTTRH